MSVASRREIACWHALLAALGSDAQREAADATLGELATDLGLPGKVVEARASVQQVVRGRPDLEALLRRPLEDEALEEDDRVRRTILFLKSALNVFGDVGGETVSAEEYTRWLEDVRDFERACGYAPGALHQSQGQGAGRGGAGRSPTGTGGGPAMGEGDVAKALDEAGRGSGLMAEPDIRAGLQGIEKRLIDHMKLREILADAKLAAKLTPSMALTEQLLRDKDHLTGPALARARDLIRRFVQDLGDVLAREVAAAPRGTIDRSVPPKRVFRNLDLKRTIYANLINWDPKSERLYVDRLYYRQTSRKLNKTRLIVVVDQSGSMVPAMVNCTILASIFAGLPKVDAYLVAYDTQALDLSPWVDDPLEVLLRTKLGGGTDGTCAMPIVHGHLVDPKNTVIVWISDFYDNRDLMPMFRSLVQSGVRFVPVGSVGSGGFFSVDDWFRKELKAIGTPVLSGSLKTLVRELKSALP